MADEPKLTDAPAAPEAPAAEVVAPPAEKAAPVDLAGEIVQLRADKAKLEAELAKRENDWRSVRGTLRGNLKAQTDTELMRQELAAIRETLTAAVTEFSQDPRAPERLAAISARQQEQAEAARKTTEGQARAVVDQIFQQVAAEHKVNFETEKQKVYQILQTDPQWSSVWEMVSEAWDAQSVPGLQAALKQIGAVRENLYEKRLTAAVEKAKADARKEAEKETKDRLKEAGVMGMPSGPAAGGSTSSLDMKSILATGVIPRSATPAQLAEINAAIDAQMRKRP